MTRIIFLYKCGDENHILNITYDTESIAVYNIHVYIELRFSGTLVFHSDTKYDLVLEWEKRIDSKIWWKKDYHSK